MLHEEPNITWKSSEEWSLIIQKNLQYAIIDKFSYDKSDIKELRKAIPAQCEIKGECIIGVLDARNIFIRFEGLKDYVQLLSTTAYYIKTCIGR